MNKLKLVYFIVSANSKIGFGHLKRCLLLADEFQKNNVSSQFISYNIAQKARVIVEQKYKCHTFNSEQSTIDNLFKTIANDSLVIIDSDFDLFYDEIFQKKFTRNKLMYITIRNDIHFFAHYLFNQNIMALSNQYKTESYTINFLGPKYFILDDQIKLISPNKIIPTKKRNLIVTFGSADPSNNTMKALSLLETFKNEFNKIRIVVGGLNPKLEEIKRLKFVVENRKQIEIHYNTNAIYSLMKKSDIAITSMGLTFWELALHEIPCLVISGSKKGKESDEIFL